MNKVYYIMGVSGSGKTSIGEALGAKMNIPFYDSDLFHPEENIEKMSAGIPLVDEDRWPWLDSIHRFVLEYLPETSLIIATSALKEKYRRILENNLNSSRVQWIYLEGSFELLSDRIGKREGHFMPASLLRSQLDTLEVPKGQNVWTIHVEPTVEEIVDQILKLV